MNSTVFALVSSPNRVESVVDKLRLAGFSTNDVSVLFRDEEGPWELSRMRAAKATDGRLSGKRASVVLGGLASWLVGLGSLVILGAGPLIAAGPIFAPLSGLPGRACGLSGALVGLGFPESKAKLYSEKVEDGNILIAAQTENHYDLEVAREILAGVEAQNIGVTHAVAVRS